MLSNRRFGGGSSPCCGGEGSHEALVSSDDWKTNGKGRATGGAAERRAHSYAEVLEAETHILPLSCINSPRLVSSQAGNFFFPSKFERSFAFTHLSPPSSALTVFHLQSAMCLLRSFIPSTSKSFDIECNFQTKDSQGRSLRAA